MRRRIQRIYPAFLVVFATYIALSFVFPAENRIPHGTAAASGYLLANALLLPGLFPIVPLITVAWSLSYEMFFYLLIPVVILTFALRARTASWRIGFFSLLVAALAACCAWFGGPVRLIMFGAGILLYELITNENVKGPGTPWVLGVLVIAFGFIAVPLAFAAATVAKSLALFGAFGVLCLSCFTRPQSWLARAASWTPMRWLGNMSYSFYLLHGLALKGALLVATPFLPASAQGPGFFVALLVPAFAVAALASAVLFIVVERPLSLRPGRGSRAKTGGATEAIAGVVLDAPDITSMSRQPVRNRAAD